MNRPIMLAAQEAAYENGAVISIVRATAGQVGSPENRTSPPIGFIFIHAPVGCRRVIV
ncbi:hypothetical protein C7434_1159 [Pantoea sp. PNA 14-12]|nr:hypothetical protein C7434_1159 [Pantoea sp. PNA 14-12]